MSGRDRETRNNTAASAHANAPAVSRARRIIEDGDRDGQAEAAQEAAQEVAEATDEFAAGGLLIEPASQARELAALEDERALAAGEEVITGEARREIGQSVFRLAWPAITENALQTLLGIVDTAVVARLGTAALSGVGASQQLIWALTTALIAVSMGTTVLVARFTGADQQQRANAVLKQSLILAVATGALLFPLGFISHPMLALFGLTPAAAAEGATYLQITLVMAIFLVVMFVAGAALRGAGDTRTPMFVTGFINVINAVLAVELVFGGAKASGMLNGWLGGGSIIPTLSFIPEMGVAGSAWASVIARAIGAALLLSVFLRSSSKLHLWGGGRWRPNFDLMWRILKIGIPSALEQLLMSVGILVYSLIVIGMGETVFATSRLALNAVFMSQMPGFGFAVAATTLVGQSLGARLPKRARLGTYMSARSAMIWMSLMGVVFFFFGEWILRIFTDDPRLLTLGADALKVIAFGQPPLALAFVLAGALRGAGDVKFPMWVTTIVVWLVRLPVGAFLGLPAVCVPFTGLCMPGLNLGLPGIYGALIVEASIRAVAMMVRFRGGKWQAIRV